jgi:class 3 adenylate cyclase
METPTTRYARSADGTFVAFQTFGTGDDVLVIMPFISHLELFWEDPDVGGLLRGLASSARVIAMDQRGMGLSDRIRGDPDLETRMDDVRAVLDAADSRLPTLWGLGVDGGALCAMLAATYPERVRGLILWPGSARSRRGPDYPWGDSQEVVEGFDRLVAESWGDEEGTRQILIDIGLATRADDHEARRRWAKIFRYASSRGDVLTFNKMWDEVDFRSILPAIRVPTLVQSRNNLEEATWVASRIPGASLQEFRDSPDYPPYVGDTDAILASVMRFVGGLQSDEAEFDRVLATVLFTDIVDSTAQSAALGDRAWHDLREQHDHVVRANLARYRGREIKTMGDGFLATFDGPARGVRCAQGIVGDLSPVGLEIRAGLHTGEVALDGDDVAGIGVAIGARVGALAGPSEVLVSSTVKDLVVGSGLTFEDAGEHELKGVPDRWRLFRVVDG